MGRPRKLKITTVKKTEAAVEQEKKIRRLNNQNYEKYLEGASQEAVERDKTREQLSIQEEINDNKATADNSGCDIDLNNDVTPRRKRVTVNHGWKKLGMKLVEWYIEAIGIGIPDPSLTDPKQQEINCQCRKKKSKLVTLYMMFGNEKKIVKHVP